MNKNPKISTHYTKEMVARLEAIDLKLFKGLTGRPDMTVEEMREMNKMNPDDSIKVSFLKRNKD